jgi:hypothetical protein
VNLIELHTLSQNIFIFSVNIDHVKFRVLSTLATMSFVSLNVPPCNLTEVQRSFREKECLHVQDRRIRQVISKKHAASRRFYERMPEPALHLLLFFTKDVLSVPVDTSNQTFLRPFFKIRNMLNDQVTYTRSIFRSYINPVKTITI